MDEAGKSVEGVGAPGIWLGEKSRVEVRERAFGLESVGLGDARCGRANMWSCRGQSRIR